MQVNAHAQKRHLLARNGIGLAIRRGLRQAARALTVTTGSHTPPASRANSRRRLAGVACAAVAGLLFACTNAAKSAALQRATTARAAGDLPGEALALQQACAADRQDTEVCTRAQTAQIHAVAAVRVTARAQCELAATSPANMPMCLQALANGRRVAPQDVELTQIADAAGRAHAVACNALVTSAPPNMTDVLRLARCAHWHHQGIATPTYAQWVRQANALVASTATRTMSEPGFAGQPGALAALRGIASCVSPSVTTKQAYETELGEFLEQMRPRLQINAAGPLAAQDVCGAVTRAMASGFEASCVTTSRFAPLVRVDLSIEIDGTEHRINERTMEQEYVARIDHYDNPEYRILARDEVYTREQLRRAEEAERDADAACRTAENALARAGRCYDCSERRERESTCRQYENATATRESRSRDANTARERLQNTPAVLEKKHWATATWQERSHTWIAAWRAELRLPDGESYTLQGTARYTDREHPAVTAVELAEDRLDPPRSGWAGIQVRDAIAKHSAPFVAKQITAAGVALRNQCQGPLQWEARWLSCRAASAWWLGEAWGPAHLLAYAARHDSAVPTPLHDAPPMSCQ